jgi:hypothetical protein
VRFPAALARDSKRSPLGTSLSSGYRAPAAETSIAAVDAVALAALHSFIMAAQPAQTDAQLEPNAVGLPQDCAVPSAVDGAPGEFVPPARVVGAEGDTLTLG